MYRGDVKLLVSGSVRYPDAAVTCSPVDGQSDVLPDPVIVFEVLSASTASIDRVTKNQEYRATASIQRYIMLEQTRIAATIFTRVDNDWIGTLVSGEALPAMPEIGIELPLSELYLDVALPPADTDD